MTGVMVVHPRTGELLEQLGRLPPETLAEAYVAIREQQAKLEDMRRELKAALQDRLDMRGVARMTTGEYEVGETRGWRSVWDGEQLEHVVRDLLAAGAVTPRDVQGLLHHETKVNGHQANALSRRLVGANKSAVEDCRAREQERRSFDVVASLPLVEAGAAPQQINEGGNK